MGENDKTIRRPNLGKVKKYFLRFLDDSDEIIARDKTSLDIFWIKDKSLTDLDNLPDPDELAEEIIQNLESGLNSFREIMRTLD